MRDLYLDTRDRFIAGELHSLAAAGRIAMDPVFRAEAELKGFIGDEAIMIAAHETVRGPWMKERLGIWKNPATTGA